MASCLGRAACLLMAQVLDRLVLSPVAFRVLVLSKAYSVANAVLGITALAAAGTYVVAERRRGTASP